MSAISIVTPAAALPLDTTFALKALRVLSGDTDLATLYLAAATDAVEDYTARSLMQKTYRLTMDGWPTSMQFWPSWPFWPITPHDHREEDPAFITLELRRSPLVSITSIKYYDSANVQQTLAGSEYVADKVSIPGRVAFPNALPTVYFRTDAVQVDFVAGSGAIAYGLSNSAIPPMLATAVLMFARQLYDNRVPLADAKMVAMPYGMRHLLLSQRVDSRVPVK
jgi:hypothetical protein